MFSAAHNLVAMNAGRQLNIVNGVKGKTAEKLSSGYRINRAADDAAGLAIANKLKVRAQGTQVATQNTQAGIHVTNIADGGYDSIMDRLQSIRELSPARTRRRSCTKPGSRDWTRRSGS